MPCRPHISIHLQVWKNASSIVGAHMPTSSMHLVLCGMSATTIFIVSSSVAISGSDEPLGQGVVPVSAQWRDECGVVAVFLMDGN